MAWIQDGWQTDEKSFLAEARAVGNSDPSLFVYLPARNKTDLANAIVAMKAAKATLDSDTVDEVTWARKPESTSVDDEKTF